MEQVTKMIDHKFIPMVECRVNGHKAYFLLDTGASISIIDLNQIQKYGIKQGDELDVNVSGYGGDVNNLSELLNCNITMGNLELKNEFNGKNISSIVKGVDNNTNYKILGIIGNNNIAPYKLILDFKEGTIKR